jgi:amidase
MTISAIPPWKSAVQQKRAAQLNAIPPSWRLPPTTLTPPLPNTLETIRTCGILSAEELEWTETDDVATLLSLLASRKVTSVQLTTAFCKRAAIAQQMTKCLTEIFFDLALARAKELDEQYEKTGILTGPLHGLPVSIKDRFDVEGLDTTVGMYCCGCGTFP